MKCSIIIPAYNEEKTIGSCLASVFSQTRLPDEVIVVNDGSIDGTVKIVKNSFNYYKGKKTKAILIDRKRNQGKIKSVEEGLKHSTGEIIITTDADTILDLKFVERITKAFHDPKVGAATGYVKSQKGTGLMAARQIEYMIGFGIHKSGQSIINGIFVIPGCSAAYRRKVLEKVEFEDDTLTEDLDLTWKVLKLGYQIAYVPRAIVKTQDPPDLKSMWRQLRRWYTGATQCLKKHKDVFSKTGMLGKFTVPLALFDSLLTTTIFLILIFVGIVDFIFYSSLTGFYWLLLFYVADLLTGSLAAIYGVYKLKRKDIVKGIPYFLVLMTLNRIAWLYSFLKEFLHPTKKRKWEKPKRI